MQEVHQISLNVSRTKWMLFHQSARSKPNRVESQNVPQLKADNKTLMTWWQKQQNTLVYEKRPLTQDMAQCKEPTANTYSM